MDPSGADPGDDGLRGLSALADPARRRLYDAVAAHDEPVGRDAAARSCGITRTLAAYHLDRLVEAGLLEVSYARPPGAGGPGAGRPAKLYRRVREDRTVSIPPRDYELLADLLAGAVGAEAGGEVRAALLRAAAAQGRAAAGADETLSEVLRARGYEPQTDERGDLVLRNCPFRRLSRAHTELVCGLNEALLQGLLEGRGEDPARAELRPHDDHCCVVIRG